MQKIFSILFFFLTVTYSAQSQDLIVTNGGDSLNVKIIDELSGAIFYEQPNRYGKVAQLRMFKTLVKDFKYNFYRKESDLPDDRLVNETRGDNQKSDYKRFMKFRVGFDVGYWQLAQLPITAVSPFEKYLKKLNSGGNFIFQAGFFPFDRLGIGAKYHRNGKLIRESVIEFIDYDKQTKTGDIRDLMSLHFIAPVIYLRQPINYKTYATLGLSGGQVFYRNNAFRTEKLLSKANGWGLGADLGVDFLQGNTAIGFDSGISFTLHYLYTNLKNLEFISSKKIDSQPFGILPHRVGVTIGIKFYKIPKYLKLTSY